MLSAPAAPLDLAAPLETTAQYRFRNRMLEIHRYIEHCKEYIGQNESRINRIKFREDLSQKAILQAIEIGQTEISLLKNRIEVAKNIRTILKNIREGPDVEDTIPDHILIRTHRLASILLDHINAEVINSTPETKMLQFALDYNPPREIERLERERLQLELENPDFDADGPPPPPLGLPSLRMVNADLGGGAFHGGFRGKKTRTKRKRNSIKKHIG